MKTLEEIKQAEHRAQETHRNAEQKRQEIIKKAALDAERITEESKKALKEKVAVLQMQEEDSLRSQKERIISEVAAKADEMKKRAEKNSGTAVNLILEKFEESFS